MFGALRKTAEKYPDQMAIIDEHRDTTYKELVSLIEWISGQLKTCGVKEGDRVGLLFVNETVFVASFYALAKIGAIAVMVNTKLRSPEIRYILEDTETRILLMNRRWLEKVQDFGEEIGIHKILFGEDLVKEWESDGISKEPVCMPGESREAAGGWMAAAIMHTSGTTGTPKGVMISHRNILETARDYQEVEGLIAGDIAVLSVPIFHILGLSCVTTNFLTLGGTVVLTDFYTPQAALKNITKYKATHFHSVPTVFLQLTKAYQDAEAGEYDLSSLRVAVCGGAVIAESDIDAFCRIAPCASFRLAYGMTETAGGGALSPGHRLALKATPNVVIRIVDEAGCPVEQGIVGEAVFEGDIVIRKFWKREQETEGSLKSGDLVWEDEQGYLHVTDRIKDIVNRGGEKIFPSVIEKAIQEFPGVKEAAVFPVGDKVYGELPAAAVVPEAGTHLLAEEIFQFLEKRIAKYELPCRIEFLAELPQTANGKVRKSELRKYFEKEGK